MKKLFIFIFLLTFSIAFSQAANVTIRLQDNSVVSGQMGKITDTKIEIDKKYYDAADIKTVSIPGKNAYVRDGEFVIRSKFLDHLDLFFLIPIILGIIFWQIKTYKDTLNKVDDYLGMFSARADSLHLQKDPDDDRVIGIISRDEKVNNNRHFKTIKESINRYLTNNRSTDFHLIKDIVDRNTDSLEAEISTQVPFPLYYGLMGTMSGIIIGIFFLIVTGGLANLMDSAAQTGSGGITSLLFGVALAMASSIAGVLLTTKASDKLKSASAVVEDRKNTFLSWAQAELLPELSTNFADEMLTMTDRLTSFNQTFSNNSRVLESSLRQVREATQGQAQMIEAINRLNVNQLATANIEVYKHLKDCSTEIGNLAEMLGNSAEYVNKVRVLNDTLNDVEQRMHAMEEVATYFKEERSQLDVVKATMAQTISDVDETTSKAAKNYADHSQEQINQLIAISGQQYEQLRKVMEEQTKAMTTRMQEIATITDELKRMAPVKDSMDKLNSNIKEQSRKMEDLMSAIRALAAAKSTGGPVPMQLFAAPKWLKISGYVVGALFATTLLTALVFFILSFVGVV